LRGGVESRVAALVETARHEGRDALLEPEALAIVESLGLRVPAQTIVRDERELAEVSLDAFPGDRIVVKVVSPRILHKSDVGGIEIVAHDRAALGDCIERMRSRFSADARVTGYALFEYIPHDPSPGGELLLGISWTDDFGPVVTLGPGGVRAESLAGPPGSPMAPILFPADTFDTPTALRLVEARGFAAMSTVEFRGQPARIAPDALVRVLERFAEFATRHVPRDISELEVNPLVLTKDGPVALDALARIGHEPAAARPARPLEKIDRLLHPSSVAILGVSERMNPGHFIVDNMVHEGYPREKIFIVKPDRESLLGCPCVPDIDSLPEPVDLCILCIDASQVPETVRTIAAGHRAESIIVIPGGLGERDGTEGLVRSLHEIIDHARDEPWRGPVINGGNCLGIRSRPGGFDTTFVPRHKIGATAGKEAPLAIISQSGAFTVSKTSKWPDIDPRYVISVGNQLDLTVGDYLTRLARDPEVRVFACYVEGFRPLDGRAWLRAAREIVASGRTVILYRGGRTPDGARAGVSHTAAVAGDYAVTVELAEQAGVVVADSLADFEDLVSLFCRLDGRSVGGKRLGALTNAGFECVAIADNLDGFELAEFGPQTRRRLGKVFERCRLDRIVEIRNPLDTTPIMPDEPTEDAIRAMLDDPSVDVAVVGCVPHTGALQTLAAGEGHDEDVEEQGSVGSRMARLFAEGTKPWIAVVDAGPLYDPFARRLEAGGVPVFRTADRALRLFDRFCRARLAQRKKGTDLFSGEVKRLKSTPRPNGK